MPGARSVNDILWRFLADTKSLDKGSRRAQQSLRGVDRETSRTGQALGGLTKAAGALGVAMGAREVIDFALEAANLARQADATAASFDTVFGPAADGLRERLDAARQMMGLGRDEMEAMLVTTGALATGMGLPQDAAADLSEKLFNLAGDLAAFNPAAGSAEDALGALQAAIRGEFDPLERFGAKLGAAEVKTRALADSGKDSVGDLNAAEIAIATMGLAAEKTAVQQGALEKANREGRLEAQKTEAAHRDLQVQLGRKLAPVLDDLTGILGNVIAATADLGSEAENSITPTSALTGQLKDWSDSLRDLNTGGGGGGDLPTTIEGVTGLADAAGWLLGWIPPVSDGLHDWADNSRNTYRANKELEGSVVDLGPTLAELDDRATRTGAAIEGVGAAGDDAGQELMDSRYYLDAYIRKLGELWDAANRTALRIGQIPGGMTAGGGSASSEADRGRSNRGTAPGNVNIPGRGGVQAQGGGVVPGPTGEPTLVLAHGGETIVPHDAEQSWPHLPPLRNGSSGAAPIVINVTGTILDPQGVAEAVADAIRLYTATNGPILSAVP